MRWKNPGLAIYLLSGMACGADGTETLHEADNSAQHTPSLDAHVEVACEPDVQAYLGEFLSDVILNAEFSESPTTLAPILVALQEATRQALGADSETPPAVLAGERTTLREIINRGSWVWVGDVPADGLAPNKFYSVEFSWRPQLRLRFNVGWSDDQTFNNVHVEPRFSEAACRDLYQPTHFSACMKESDLSDRLGIEVSDFNLDLCRDGGCEFSAIVSFRVEQGTSIESAQLRTSSDFDWIDFSKYGDEFSIDFEYVQHGEFQIYLATLLGTWTGCYSMAEYEGVRVD